MNKFKNWFNTYKHHLSLGVFVGGFIFDSISLGQIDLSTAQLVLLGYLLFVGLGIILYNLFNYQWLLLCLQFAFGNLFSGVFLLFFNSASWAISWPFLIILFLVFLSSEFGKKHYLRFSFQLVIFYFALYSFLILSLPILLKEISARVFLLSGLLSLILMIVFLKLLAKIFSQLFVLSKQRLWRGIGGVFLTINLFYFTNILPPIPLALRDAGVFHYIARQGNNFSAQEEDLPWWRSFQPYPLLHLAANSPAYFYAAIFAPTDLSVGIVHHWEHYDEVAKKWQTTARIKIDILGGREGGYRSYSFLKIPEDGWWRVSVETHRGQVIGRQEFKVNLVNSVDIRTKLKFQTVNF